MLQDLADKGFLTEGARRRRRHESNVDRCRQWRPAIPLDGLAVFWSSVARRLKPSAIPARRTRRTDASLPPAIAPIAPIRWSSRRGKQRSCDNRRNGKKVLNRACGKLACCRSISPAANPPRRKESGRTLYKARPAMSGCTPTSSHQAVLLNQGEACRARGRPGCVTCRSVFQANEPVVADRVRRF